MIFGGILNQVLLWPLIFVVSNVLMTVAEAVTRDRFSWPQISFMSAYPEDVRNGYVLFAAAVFVCVFLFSGILAAIFKASPGKALVGFCYQRQTGVPCTTGDFLRRAAAILVLLMPIFLVGPVLGFLIGPAADTASGISLLVGLGFGLWAVSALSLDRPSPLNRALKMRPVHRNRQTRG